MKIGITWRERNERCIAKWKRGRDEATTARPHFCLIPRTLRDGRYVWLESVWKVGGFPAGEETAYFATRDQAAARADSNRSLLQRSPWNYA